MNNKVVYLHKDCYGNVRYVGSGTLKRAKTVVAKSFRGLLYENFVKENGQMTVEILEEGLSRVDSINLEIKKYLEYVELGFLLNVNLPRKIRVLPSYEDLIDVLEYDETSESCLRWKNPRTNTIKAGEVAGTLSPSGYYVVGFNNKIYPAHQLVLILNGYVVNNVDFVIDHIDRDKSNNLVSNLRQISQGENTRNLSKRAVNSTGITGVCLQKQSDGTLTYVARVTIPNGRQLKRGFAIKKYGKDKAFQLACKARIEMLKSIEKEHNVSYNENHGS